MGRRKSPEKAEISDKERRFFALYKVDPTTVMGLSDRTAGGGGFWSAASGKEIGQALLRPGVQACEVDAAVRGHLSDLGYEYPHHSGHGIGVSHFERPYIMPWNNEKLENDMVVALEPGVYAPALGGIRLEWVFRVTDDGGEPLSRFSLNIAQS